MVADIVKEAEEAVISAILRDAATVLPELATMLEAADFYDYTLGEIYDTAQKMSLNAEHVDWITMGHQHIKVPMTRLSELDGKNIHSASATHYAKIVVEQAGRRRLANVARNLTQLSEADTDFDTIMDSARKAFDSITASTKHTVEPIGWEQMREEFADRPKEQVYEWIIPDILARQERLIISGSEGGGKSLWVRQMATSLAGGLHPFDPTQQITPRKVLVIDVENSKAQWWDEADWLTLRVGNKVGQLPDPNLKLVCTIDTPERLNLLTQRSVGTVLRWVDRVKPDVVFIGPLHKLIPKSLNSDDEVAPLLAALDAIRNKGCALIIEAHAGKSTDKEGDRNFAPRGSSALLGWPEFGFGFSVTINKEDNSRVAEIQRWRGDRDAKRKWASSYVSGGDLPWLPAAW